MSKRTFKKRKICLHLNFVNYKFINLPIFTPPLFYKFSHFAIRFISSAKIRLFRFLPMRFVRFAWIREIKCEKIMESFWRISPKDKNITPKDSRISPKDKKLSPKDSGISPKDKKLSPKDSRISPKDKPRRQM